MQTLPLKLISAKTHHHNNLIRQTGGDGTNDKTDTFESFTTIGPKTEKNDKMNYLDSLAH